MSAPLVLASKSASRRTMLENAGVAFEAVPDLDRTDWTAEAVARSHSDTDEALGLTVLSRG